MKINEPFLVNDDACPECGAQWAYEQDGKRFSYIVAVIERDRVARWRCPACKTEWPRYALAVGSGSAAQPKAANDE